MAQSREDYQPFTMYTLLHINVLSMWIVTFAFIWPPIFMVNFLSLCCPLQISPAVVFLVRFEIFTVVTTKNGVFWDVTPCGSIISVRIGELWTTLTVTSNWRNATGLYLPFGFPWPYIILFTKKVTGLSFVSFVALHIGILHEKEMVDM
jgi:hypothetical protein